MSENSRKKIYLFREHFAWIDSEFLYMFEEITKTVSMTKFIREQAYMDFKIYLNSTEDILYFNQLLKETHYKDKTEWLREKMRN